MIRKTTPGRLSFFRRNLRCPYHGAGFRTASTGAAYLRSSPGALADMVKLRGQLLVHRDRLGQSSLLAALRQGSHAAFEWPNFAHLFSVSLLPLSTAWMAVSSLSPQPVAFYAAVFFFVNVTYILLIWKLIEPRADVPSRVRGSMRYRSIATLCLFAIASLVALKYPFLGLGICCCCLIGYLRPGAPGTADLC